MPIKPDRGKNPDLTARARAGQLGIFSSVRATPVARQFASRLALIAFTAASLRGLISGADFQGTLQTALIAMAVFYGLGLVLGELARRVVEEHVVAEWARLTADRESHALSEPA
jgi:hypothetical protein